MKRILLAALLFAACQKREATTPPLAERKLADAPPPPALQLPKEKEDNDEEGFHVVDGRPHGKLLPGARPTITFSEPVVALGDANPPQLKIDPAIKGKWRWLGSSTVEFDAEEPWPMSTAFHAVVPAGLKALDGTPLEQTWQLDFTTPTVAVDRYSVNPPSYLCKWSAPSQHFEITVNQAVKEPEKVFFFEAGDEKHMVAAKILKSEPVKQGVRYEIAPAQDLPRDARFAVGLDGQAYGVQGDLPAGVEWRQECRTMGAMEIARLERCYENEHCSHGPLALDFTNPLADPKELATRVHFKPDVAVEWDAVELQQNATRAVLFGKFRPGMLYDVHVDPGVKDTLGQGAPAFDAQVKLDDLLPSLYVGQPLALLEASGDGQLPAQVTNLSSLDADLWAVTPQEMAGLELPRTNVFPKRPPDVSLHQQLSYPKNEPHLHPIDLRAAKSALVAVRLRAPGTEFAQYPLRVLAQITGLAVHAKIGASGSLAWVTGVETAKPVAGAGVKVYAESGAQLAEATTDANGLAVLPGYDKLAGVRKEGWEPPRVLVAASLGDDLGYVTTSFYGDDVEAPRNFDVLKKDGLGIVFTDRGIYRPGDVVHVKGILRQQQEGALLTPAGESVTVLVSDPDGKQVVKQSVSLSKYGTFTLDATVPKEARLGSFSVEAQKFTSASFLVAEYRAPQFRVDVQVAKPELFAGDELSGTVIARYLFGGAMAGAQAQWSAGRQTEDFAPPRNDGFRFGRNTWSFDDKQPPRDNGAFASGQGEIGKDGTLAVQAGKVEAPGDRPARYTLEAEVADVSRQRVAGRASVLVHPAAYYVGIGATSLFAKAGETLAVPVIAAAPNGDRVDAKIHVAALLRSWHSVRKRGANGVYETVSEPVEEKASECDAQSGQDCKLTLQKPGFYDLRAESRDPAGRLALTTASVYAIGQGFAAWQESDTNRVEIVPDKASYEVGDTAHLLIKSPFQSCKALVSLEREGIADAHVVELTGSAATIDVPVREEHVPNVFAGVVLVRERVKSSEAGDDPGRPSMRIGYVNLKVGTSSKRLKVSVTTPKPEYRPREKVAVDIAVSKQAGGAGFAGDGRRAEPGVLEVQLYAVDDAVLRLTSYQLPDPLGAMFPDHALAVAVGEPMGRLVRRQRFGEKGEVQPGGGGGLGPPGDVRSKFLTTVLWQTLTTDAQGKAHAEIELPDNLTTFRIFAVAATDKDSFGAGQAEVRVALPLLVLPALPRLARVGDELEAGVAVHSTKTLDVTVSAEVDGLALTGEKQRTVHVEAGVAKEVRFKLKAEKPGKATLRFRAAAGDMSDAVQETIPVQMPVEMEAVAVAGETTSKREEGLVPPQGMRKDVGGLEISLASTALGGLNDAIDQLVEYPYGCVEQLSSRLVPFVAVREVERVFGLPPHPDQVVTDTVAKIEALQVPSGGFVYWPGLECPYPWPSIYAALALSRAQEMDYPVHKDVLVRARRYLASIAAGEKGCARVPPDDETRIFALQVLARMGDPKPSYYDELYAEKDKLPLFSKAQLADAIAVGRGKRARADALLQDIMDSARETPRDVHFEEQGEWAPMLSSDTRTTGMVLQTLVDLKPQSPMVGKIARYLTDVRKGGKYRTTQEAAYSLMGLAELVRVKERQAPDFAARVVLGSKEIASAEFRKRTLDVVTKKLPLNDLGKGALDFTVDGQGTLYYTALLRYAPLELPTQPRNEGLFVQRWFEPYSESGKQATEFGAGELVRVRVRVATPQERQFVAIDIPLPAGLEAVDTALATTRVVPRARDEEAQEHEGTEADSAEDVPEFWSPFTYSEKRDDRVVYFSDHLPPGVHTATFVARATTPGRFVLKPAHAEEMYAPEVFGRSDGGTLTVVAQQPVASSP